MIFYFTASNIVARHNLLLEALGPVFPEEEQSYYLVSNLSWILPVVVLCAGLIDLALVIVYMNYGHPWRGIISKEKQYEYNQFHDLSDVESEPENCQNSADCVAEDEETTL